MEDKKVFDGNISMLRLSEKRNLLEDCAVIFLGLSKYREVLPKKFRKKTTRSVMADFNRGLRIVNKRVPVYVELPLLEAKDNGVYREVNPKTKEPLTNELVVNTLEHNYQAEIGNCMHDVLDYTDKNLN